MTKTLAVEWAKYNINVNCVAPGVIISTVWELGNCVVMSRGRIVMVTTLLMEQEKRHHLSVVELVKK